MTVAADSTVRRRVVGYLSGFDPQGPAHYHQLYREAAQAQAQLQGYRVTVGERRRLDKITADWDVHLLNDQAQVHTRYEFWRWDDVVRQQWPRGRRALLQRTLWASVEMLRNGVMAHVLRRSWPMFLAMALPGLLMLALLLCSALLLSLVWLLAVQELPVAAAVTLMTGLGALVALARVAEARSQMAWLMRSMACLVEQGRGQTPTLDARLDAHAKRLAALLTQGGVDEVLVVGHSSGAMMACIVWARALALLPPDHGPSAGMQWSLLTLGHCSQLLSEQPEAQTYRSELSRLAADTRLTWVDVTSPVDGCCMALVAPTEFGHRHGPIPEAGPKLINPRFIQLFEAGRYRVLRRDKFRCHFQYILAGDRPGEWDYIAVSAGPLALAQRFRSVPGVQGFREFELFGGPDR